MKTFVGILAAGKADRWLRTKTPELPEQKHLVPIGGTTLLERTRKQLDSRSIFTTLVTNDGSLELVWNSFFRPGEIEDFTLSTLLSTQHLWSDQNIILLGDVFYTENALDSILKDARKPLRFVGNSQEIFAFRFSRYNEEYVVEQCKKVLSQPPPLRAFGKFRDLRWQMRHGSVQPPGKEPKDRSEDNNFDSVGDKTMDVDTLKDYKLLLRRIEKGQLIV